MHPALSQIEHRPWPLPRRAWKWGQSWVELAFVHYRVDATELRSLLPIGLELEEYCGSAWVGVVPFRMGNVRRRFCPTLPFLSTFPELNLRTYVRAGGKSGVWFFSLDAANRAIVFGGRRFYNIPYHLATMSLDERNGWHYFQSRRRSDNTSFKARYRLRGEEFRASKGSFEHWATERYCLYSVSPAQKLTRVEVHHKPWPLQNAEVEIEHNGLFRAAHVKPAEGEPICHFSRGVDVTSFGSEVIE